MSGDYTIRAARARDASAVAAMWSVMAEQHRAYDSEVWCWSPEAVEHWQTWFESLIGKSEMVVLVAEMPGGELAGFAVGACKVNPAIFTIAKAGEVWDLFVRPEFRRRGIGRGLMEAALAALQKLGAQDVKLHVAIANADAVALYESMGLRPVMYRMYKQFE